MPDPYMEQHDPSMGGMVHHDPTMGPMSHDPSMGSMPHDPSMGNMGHHDASSQPDTKPSFDESLESDYSTPNSRNRRIIREIIV